MLCCNIKMEGLTKYIHKGREKDIELHILDNIHDISKNCSWGDILKFESQKRFRRENYRSRSICDIMIWHKDQSGTLIEVKKFKYELSQCLAIGQILSYAELVKIHLGNYPRLVIASDYISPLLKMVIKNQSLPIKTLQVDGEIITYT